MSPVSKPLQDIVVQADRDAGFPRGRAECLGAGLSGELVITKLAFASLRIWPRIRGPHSRRFKARIMRPVSETSTPRSSQCSPSPSYSGRPFRFAFGIHFRLVAEASTMTKPLCPGSLLLSLGKIISLMSGHLHGVLGPPLCHPPRLPLSSHTAFVRGPAGDLSGLVRETGRPLETGECDDGTSQR